MRKCVHAASALYYGFMKQDLLAIARSYLPLLAYAAVAVAVVWMAPALKLEGPGVWVAALITGVATLFVWHRLNYGVSWLRRVIFGFLILGMSVQAAVLVEFVTSMSKF
ncbi:MAG: hypothetical protein K0S68_919 [Candidatus Saccharibacteria bacterium]|jgi:hypothetical protein|nr:hypothetical protein [Candidatus Saccharibacteria bacterium]